MTRTDARTDAARQRERDAATEGTAAAAKADSSVATGRDKRTAGSGGPKPCIIGGCTIPRLDPELTGGKDSGLCGGHWNSRRGDRLR